MDRNLALRIADGQPEYGFYVICLLDGRCDINLDTILGHQLAWCEAHQDYPILVWLN